METPCGTEGVAKALGKAKRKRSWNNLVRATIDSFSTAHYISKSSQIIDLRGFSFSVEFGRTRFWSSFDSPGFHQLCLFHQKFKDMIASLTFYPNESEKNAKTGKIPCPSPLDDWTKIGGQFSHSKFRNHGRTKTTIQSGGEAQYSPGG